MQNLLSNFQNCLLNTYILIPFVFAFLFVVLKFFKNPIRIKRASDILFFVCLIFSFILFISGDDYSTSFFQINFSLNRLTSIFSFVITFIFLLISLFSKTCIFKLHKMLRAALFILYGLLNLIIISDNIFCVFVCCFWLFSIFYFLYTSFAKDTKTKNDISYQFVFDIFLLLGSLFLIMFDFYRYFALNDIPFNFSNVSENIGHINHSSTAIALSGFLILTSRLFNFLPFAGNNISFSNRVNPFIYTCTMLTSSAAGGFLTLKIYSVFVNLFFEFQEFIFFFMLINFLWFIVLSCRQDSLTKFANCLIPACNIIAIVNLFSFKEYGVVSYTYSIAVNILSYCFLCLSFIVLSQKLNTDNIDELKKINPKNKILLFFIIFSILNFAGIPFFGIFSSRFLTFVNLFSSDLEGIFMNIMPYTAVVGSYILTFCLLNILYGIVIAPVQTKKNQDYLCKNQVAVLFLLLFVALVTGVFAFDICGLFNQIFMLGDF